MKIGVIGAGRLGITFALLCEKAGYEVIVSDKRDDYVYNLNHGICDTNEPLIQKMLFEVNNFSATTSNVEIIENSYNKYQDIELYLKYLNLIFLTNISIEH